jgi:hypothetical protein
MGMSGDMDAAVAEGSTIVRVGSALFGAARVMSSAKIWLFFSSVATRAQN